MTDTDDRTPWQTDRDRAERTGKWPGSWGPYHRHFAPFGAIHRDGGPECGQPGTPRRVYVFDPDALDAHEAAVTRRATEQAQLAAAAPDQRVQVTYIIETKRPGRMWLTLWNAHSAEVDEEFALATFESFRDSRIADTQYRLLRRTSRITDEELGTTAGAT